MKRISIIVGVLVIFSLLLVGALSCGSSANTKVSLGTQFTLPVGKMVEVTGEGLTLKFVEMVGDSRCATGVVCIWAGEASCLVTATYNGKATDIVFVQNGGNLTDKDFLGKYKASFTVEPYPEAGKTIDKPDYRLVMTITK